VNQKILAMELVCDMWVPILKKSSKISASQKQVVKFSASPQIKFYHYSTGTDASCRAEVTLLHFGKFTALFGSPIKNSCSPHQLQLLQEASFILSAFASAA
jgi:hypothetical protein